MKRSPIYVPDTRSSFPGARFIYTDKKHYTRITILGTPTWEGEFDEVFDTAPDGTAFVSLDGAMTIKDEGPDILISPDMPLYATVRRLAEAGDPLTASYVSWRNS